MEPLHFTANRAKVIALIVFLFTFVPLCSWFLTWDKSHYVVLPQLHVAYIGWAGLVFTLILPFLLPWHLLRAGPHVVMDENGIDERGGLGFIPWSDVINATVTSMGRGKGNYLGLILQQPHVYLARLSFIRRLHAHANAAFGIPATMINFSQLEPGIDVAVLRMTACVNAYRAAHQFLSSNHPSP